MSVKPKIARIHIECTKEPEMVPDWLGEFSQHPKEGAIDIWERHRDKSLFHYFNPENPEYAEADLKEYEAFMDGDWYLVFIRAVATVGICTGGLYLSTTIESNGIGGVTSDKESITDYAREEMACLKTLVTGAGIAWSDEMEKSALENIEIKEGNRYA